MKKIILDLAVSLDGFIEGKNGETDWCIMDEEMDFGSFLTEIDTIFYGRVSYDLWGNYEPEASTSENDLQMWSAIHAKKKYVFSSQARTDTQATFLATDIVEEVTRIKEQNGKDIWLYGGAKLIKTFVKHELIDIYRISIHPIVLGEGTPLFENLSGRINLKLLDVNKYKSGVVQLIYEQKR